MANVTRKPDYNVSILVRDSARGVKGRVGAAWKQRDGSIQIKLDACAILQGPAYAPDMLITLFPVKEEATAEARPRPAPPPDDLEDDIPF